MIVLEVKQLARRSNKHSALFTSYWLLVLHFDTEDGGIGLLRNVGKPRFISQDRLPTV
jgi:hypothetical protein